MSAAWRIVSQSDWLPMITPTCGLGACSGMAVPAWLRRGRLFGISVIIAAFFRRLPCQPRGDKVKYIESFPRRIGKRLMTQHAATFGLIVRLAAGRAALLAIAAIAAAG